MNRSQEAREQPPKGKSFFHTLFIVAIIGIVAILSWYGKQQYAHWESGEFSRYLLEQQVPLSDLFPGIPITSVSYPLFYIASRFFADYVVSLIFALLFLWAAAGYNKKFEDRFFHPEEPYLGALGIFLSGHPGWIFYFVGLIILYLLIHVGSAATLFFRNAAGAAPAQRISLYYLWIPAAIFAIMVQNVLLSQSSLWRMLLI